MRNRKSAKDSFEIRLYSLYYSEYVGTTLPGVATCVRVHGVQAQLGHKGKFERENKKFSTKTDVAQSGADFEVRPTVVGKTNMQLVRGEALTLS